MLKRGVTNLANAPPLSGERNATPSPTTKKSEAEVPVKMTFIGGRT